jgi:outer membrane lipoprotein SlyB
MHRLIALGMIASWLSGCASYGGWEPTIDPRAGTNKGTLDQDLAECKELAGKASGGTATEAAKGTAVGALGGTAAGAVIGAVTGSTARGAATGAAIGGVGGAAKEGLSAEHQYKRSYIKCLEGRGHRVVN